MTVATYVRVADECWIALAFCIVPIQIDLPFLPAKYLIASRWKRFCPSFELEFRRTSTSTMLPTCPLIQRPTECFSGQAMETIAFTNLVTSLIQKGGARHALNEGDFRPRQHCWIGTNATTAGALPASSGRALFFK
jgi:hypothetical protein